MAKKKVAKKVTKKARAPKRAPSRASAVAVAQPSRVPDPETVRAAVATLRSAADQYRDEISVIPDDGEIPQEMVAVAEFARRGKDALGDIAKMFAANALRIRDGGGSCEPGQFRVDYDLVKGRRSTAWKTLAIENRRLFCEAAEFDFDATQYAKLAQANTKPSPDSYAPVIRETS